MGGRASLVALVVKNPPANAGDARDMGLIPGSGRPPGGGHGNPFQYSCLENPMHRGAWWATVHGVAKSQTRLKWLCTHVGWGEELGGSLAQGMPNSVLKRSWGLPGSLPQTSSLRWLRSVLDSCQAHIFLVSLPERKALIFPFSSPFCPLLFLLVLTPSLSLSSPPTQNPREGLW